MSYFDQKCFVNVCFHEFAPKPTKELVTAPDGSRGYNWSLPYHVSKMKHDQDSNKDVCTTFDVIFHNEIISNLVYPEF
jgi:hypothetical protein